MYQPQIQGKYRTSKPLKLVRCRARGTTEKKPDLTEVGGGFQAVEALSISRSDSQGRTHAPLPRKPSGQAGEDTT